jgi:predicted dehydrogenase
MKICIIGCNGHWGYAGKEIGKHEVVGVLAGFDGENMQGVQNSLKNRGIEAPIVSGLDELFALNPEVAIINTRFDLNSYYTIECLKRNIYVFSEKPLATTYEDLEKIETVASKAFVSAMFGITFEAWCETLKEAVKNIGEIRMLNGRKSYKLGTRPDFFKSKETFGGIIPWVGIHAIHWIYAASGLKFKSVIANADNSVNNGYGDLETTSACIFTMENGAIATVTADYFRPSTADTHDDDRIRVVGTKGVVEYQCGKVTIIDENGTRELELLPAKDVFALFLDRISGKDVGVSMEESLYITKVALKARQAADSGQCVII